MQSSRFTQYINRENAVFEKTAGGFVSLKLNGETYERVNVVRCFPLTEPEKFISVRKPDVKGEEIGIIAALADVNEETRAMLTEQIELRYFMPEIKRINNTRDESGYAYFDTETDRGNVKFTIMINQGAVTRLTDTRIIITDIDGCRFEIPDITKLSVAEQRKMENY